MMRNPLEVLGLLTVYLFLVLKWGPRFMTNRKAYDLKWIMIVYNIGWSFCFIYPLRLILIPPFSSNCCLWPIGVCLAEGLLLQRLQYHLPARGLFGDSSGTEDRPLLLRLLRGQSNRSLGHGEPLLIFFSTFHTVLVVEPSRVNDSA